jgi:hypothetical protein
MRTGTANLPLHGGQCPRWLFERMVPLSRAIVETIVMEFGPEEVLARLSDPLWFQALGCVLGFDWHSSGLTTTVTGALKEGLRPIEGEVGVFISGGKGATSRKTPSEILARGEKYGLASDLERLVYSSRMAAKVDNAAIQDGFQLYHHVFVFTRSGNWAVVQQGMNKESRYARRYHWLGKLEQEFVDEPHSGILGPKAKEVIDLTAKESSKARDASTQLARQSPQETLKEYASAIGIPQQGVLPGFTLPSCHPVPKSGYLNRALLQAYENQPQDFEQLLALKGVGPATVRALALVSEVVWGAPPSRKDPVRYSFAHGGKDGFPYPVSRAEYEKSISVFESAIKSAKLGRSDKMKALGRLSQLQLGPSASTFENS